MNPLIQVQASFNSVLYNFAAGIVFLGGGNMLWNQGNLLLVESKKAQQSAAVNRGKVIEYTGQAGRYYEDYCLSESNISGWITNSAYYNQQFEYYSGLASVNDQEYSQNNNQEHEFKYKGKLYKGSGAACIGIGAYFLINAFIKIPRRTSNNIKIYASTNLINTTCALAYKF
jgi:hypothetical protein